MFCPNCGTELPDDANFCTECGSQIQAAEQQSAAKTETGEPLFTVKPVFIPGLTILQLLPFQFFGTAWLAGFLGVPAVILIQVLDFNVPMWAPFVIGGAIGFFGIPLIGYKLMKRTYELTEYTFYPDRLEYTEGYLQAHDKRVRYDNVVEASMKRGIFQKKYDLGTIYLKTPGGGGTGSSSSSWSGIKISNIPDPEEVYKGIQEVAGV